MITLAALVLGTYINNLTPSEAAVCAQNSFLLKDDTYIEYYVGTLRKAHGENLNTKEFAQEVIVLYYNHMNVMMSVNQITFEQSQLLLQHLCEEKVVLEEK